MPSGEIDERRDVLKPGPKMRKVLRGFRTGARSRPSSSAKREADTKKETSTGAGQSQVGPIIRKLSLLFLSGAGIFTALWIVKQVIVLAAGSSIPAPLINKFPIGYSWVLRFSPFILSWWVDLALGSALATVLVLLISTRQSVGGPVMGFLGGATAVGLFYVGSSWALTLLLISTSTLLACSYTAVTIRKDGKILSKFLDFSLTSGLAAGLLPGIVFGSVYFLILSLCLVLSYLVVYFLLLAIAALDSSQEGDS